MTDRASPLGWPLLFGLILFASATVLLSLVQIDSNNNVVTKSTQDSRLLFSWFDSAKKDPPMRILYTMTTLAEYNDGQRSTKRGSDRLQETLIPVLSEGVHSMLSFGYEVDVFLVCGFKMRPERLQLIRNSLPQSVGLRYWDDAIPLGYDTGTFHEGDGKSKLRNRTISLAREHRFVIRDNFLHYDFFVNFEDDMVIKGDHVEYFLHVTEELYRLKAQAPDRVEGFPDDKRVYERTFSGPMNKGQISRMFPGFIRAEVLLNMDKIDQALQSPIPVDMQFYDRDSQTEYAGQVDPKTCCFMSPERATPKKPAKAIPEQLLIWETDILALGVRQMPADSWLDWVTLLRGPRNHQEMAKYSIIGDYWSGKAGYFEEKKRRPGPGDRKYINNMGGWMASRRQIWDWHTEICPGGFLPPYEAPHYRFDGLDLRDVEWWSGGLHLSTTLHSCNMQRIVSLDPKNFSKHLIYHSANNKQTQFSMQRFRNAPTLLGELNTVRKSAEKELRQS